MQKILKSLVIVAEIGNSCLKHTISRKYEEKYLPYLKKLFTDLKEYVRKIKLLLCYVEKDTIKLAPLNLFENIIIHKLLHIALSKYNLKN